MRDFADAVAALGRRQRTPIVPVLALREKMPVAFARIIGPQRIDGPLKHLRDLHSVDDKQVSDGLCPVSGRISDGLRRA